mmetsp:Transcript_31596/g.83083  ORF Transcript_31596/g.83083 Transcript_31596/m.83083 type:complete len:301 (-) Transcript_31596:650-1552(-)
MVVRLLSHVAVLTLPSTRVCVEFVRVQIVLATHLHVENRLLAAVLLQEGGHVVQLVGVPPAVNRLHLHAPEVFARLHLDHAALRGLLLALHGNGTGQRVPLLCCPSSLLLCRIVLGGRGLPSVVPNELHAVLSPAVCQQDKSLAQLLRRHQVRHQLVAWLIASIARVLDIPRHVAQLVRDATTPSEDISVLRAGQDVAHATAQCPDGGQASQDLRPQDGRGLDVEALAALLGPAPGEDAAAGEERRRDVEAAADPGGALEAWHLGHRGDADAREAQPHLAAAIQAAAASSRCQRDKAALR